ncbi:hemicentin-1 [Caerostris extrusa]|uniref:Hemicentin-1 n=1 Tax=Caerostris extrusa TaxID=172846 RepID=A0AAV4SII3_CAEEX|nr:hemicentin-1 [Caerostris extrusa]
MEFKWLRNGQEIGRGRQNIHISSLPLISNLIIDPLRSDDTGNYTCLVSSRGLTGSFTTSLEVMVPPSWSIAPSDTDASSGDSLLLNCKGMGRPEPVVVWSKVQGENVGSVPISSTNRATIFSNGSFYIENIAKEDEGMYQCNVSNGIGKPLIKTVLIKKRLDRMKMEHYHSLLFLSVALVWIHYADPLKSEDSGNYTCVVSSRGLTGSFTTALDVLVPPSWVVSPMDTDASSGDSLLLNCKGTGKPEPIVSWFKTHGENMDFSPVSAFSQVTVFSNGSLYIESVEKR